jgi:hypothetical protein
MLNNKTPWTDGLYGPEEWITEHDLKHWCFGGDGDGDGSGDDDDTELSIDDPALAADTGPDTSPGADDQESADAMDAQLGTNMAQGLGVGSHEGEISIENDTFDQSLSPIGGPEGEAEFNSSEGAINQSIGESVASVAHTDPGIMTGLMGLLGITPTAHTVTLAGNQNAPPGFDLGYGYDFENPALGAVASLVGGPVGGALYGGVTNAMQNDIGGLVNAAVPGPAIPGSSDALNSILGIQSNPQATTVGLGSHSAPLGTFGAFGFNR